MFVFTFIYEANDQMHFKIKRKNSNRKFDLFASINGKKINSFIINITIKKKIDLNFFLYK